jgi:hypothetical protein
MDQLKLATCCLIGLATICYTFVKLANGCTNTETKQRANIQLAMLTKSNLSSGESAG